MKAPKSAEDKKQASIRFTDDDLGKLQKIGCAIEMIKRLALSLAGCDEETDLSTGIDLAKNLFWPIYYELDERFKAIPMKQQKSREVQAEEDNNQMLVSKEALSEIRVTIHDSLETAINMCMECSQSYDAGDAVMLMRPAVERLAAICQENHFPE
jgi:hypothetical protein